MAYYDPDLPMRTLELRWSICGMTGRKIGAWLHAGPLSILVQVPRKHPRNPSVGRLLMGWGKRWVLDSWRDRG